MRTIVKEIDLPDVIEALNDLDYVVFDVETTGLFPYQQAEMFSLAIGDLSGNSWYFNFQTYENLSSDNVLQFEDVKPITDKSRTWIAHNAKFDMHFMAKHGIPVTGRVVDTKAIARLFENHHHPWTSGGGYSLDACSKRWLDQEKDDRVKTWMNDNEAFTTTPGPNGSLRKDYHFDQVPFHIISEYAMIDAEVTAELYKYLVQKMYPTPMFETEINLTTVLFEIERRGILLDYEYCKAAYSFEQLRMKFFEKEAEAQMPEGIQFKDHANTLGPLFKARGLELPETEKGNVQVVDKILSKSEDPLAKAVCGYRDASKRMNTYWSNYLYGRDDDNVIHPSFDQAGTTTGRMSCRDPNLQNIPAEDEDSDYPVRRAFIARPGFKLLALDYKAIEFRLALEYAGETDLIDKIKDGHDPHQAAADLTGLTRKQAKVFNFAVLFGAGLAKIAEMLSCSVAEAKVAKQEYFRGLPKLQRFIYQASDRMKARGYTFNCYLRRMYLDDPNFAYRATNAIIQGSAADVMKRAMVDIYEFLKDKKSQMILTVHDEICLELHDSEHDLVPEIKRLMEAAYTPILMPMECSVEIGPNYFDMEEF